MKKEITTQIPPSNDTEYFGDGDVQKVFRKDLKNIVCEKCSWKLLADKRSVECEVCGRGFKFLTHQVEEFQDHIEIQTLTGKLNIALSMSR